jgi:hypothetical protein
MIWKFSFEFFYEVRKKSLKIILIWGITYKSRFEKWGDFQHKSLLTFGFLAQIIIIILNLAILLYALFKLHEQLENRNI